jgi:hypothetical protein
MSVRQASMERQRMCALAAAHALLANACNSARLAYDGYSSSSSLIREDSLSNGSITVAVHVYMKAGGWQSSRPGGSAAQSL